MKGSGRSQGRHNPHELFKAFHPPRDGHTSSVRLYHDGNRTTRKDPADLPRALGLLSILFVVGKGEGV
ncbi:hypothetical protein V6N13_104588 [Hibiscus sabdariffa]